MQYYLTTLQASYLFVFVFEWKLLDRPELCYTVGMTADLHIWQLWANKLHTWGVSEWVSIILEAAGPLTILGAQAVYLSEPFLRGAFSISHLHALERLLEDPEKAVGFAALLREVNTA